MADYVNNQKKAMRTQKSDKPMVYNLIEDDNAVRLTPIGNQFSVCTKCGKKFEQNVVEDLNRYSNFKTCNKCRWDLAKRKEKKVAEKGEHEVSLLTLPFKPHPWQQTAIKDFETHRFSLWACGNRSGKDFCANMIGIKYFIECLNENRNVEKPQLAPSVLWWIVAPTDNLSNQNWRDLKKQFPKDWIVGCSDSTKTMQTIGNGIIEVRSAYNPEHLVGVGLDLVTITEAARIPDLNIVWANLEARLNSPDRGLERDRYGKSHGSGKAIINSTPIGKNFFYEMWKWGQPNSNNYSSNWVSYQLPWTCNPTNAELEQEMVTTKYGQMTYGEDLRRRLGDRLYRQNYLADFLAMDGTVFKDFEENCVTNIFSGSFNFTKQQKEDFTREWQTPIYGHTYRIGYDPATGSSADTPAIVVRDKQNNNIVFIESLYGKSYDQQWDEIAYVSSRYNYAECAWLRTGHTAVENQLAKRGVFEIPLDEQGGKKTQYIQSLERAIQNKDVHVLFDGSDTTQTLIFEMNDYSEKNGKYSNEQVAHDDFVSAMYAVYFDYSVESVKPVEFSSLILSF